MLLCPVLIATLFEMVRPNEKIKEIEKGRKTVYSPCFVVVFSCPWLLEENDVCMYLGSTGCCSDVWSKAACLKYGFVMNVIGCALIACSALALSSESNLLSWVSFSSAIITAKTTITDAADATTTSINALANGQQSILLEVGLRAILMQRIASSDASVPSASTNETVPSSIIIP